MARMRTSAIALFLLGLLSAAPRASAGMWVTAYYPGWRQSRLAPENIDYAAVTHVVHFAVFPRPDGTLDSAVNLMTPANVTAAVAAAHHAGRKILFTVGGQSTRTQFLGAMSPKNRAAFIANLVKFMKAGDYDGIDVDMEEIQAADGPAFSRFIRDLRRRLDQESPRPLLTAAALWQPALFAQLSGELDQINLMTYNLSGPYPGWVVWHSGSLYNGGHRFPNGQASLPSVDGLAQTFLAAGVPRAKLGVGLSFNGYVWSGGGVSKPRQAWESQPSITNLPYYAIAERYKLSDVESATPGYHWDAQAQAAYLSIEGAGPAEAQFVSYGNETTAAKTVGYVRAKGLGGMIIWDLGAGWRADQPPGRRDLLLQAVKQARLAAASEAP